MKAKALIVSYKAHEKLIEYIEKLGIKVILSTDANVLKGINDHPDLQVHFVDKKTMIVAPELYTYYAKKLKDYDLEVLKGKTSLNLKYPMDCPYNVARVGNYYITKKDVIDPILEVNLQERGLKPIYQKQAYAKCMTIGFDDLAITCDKSIEKALKKEGVDTRYIVPENIKLDGFNIGFLGGSCGIIDERKILFTGSICQLRDFNILKSIIDEKEIEIYAPDLDLVDLGSLIPIF